MGDTKLTCVKCGREIDREQYCGDCTDKYRHQIADLEAKVERLLNVGGPCTTCGGIPPVSGLPCVCSGQNTMLAEINGLRRELVETSALLKLEGRKEK